MLFVVDGKVDLIWFDRCEDDANDDDDDKKEDECECFVQASQEMQARITAQTSER